MIELGGIVLIWFLSVVMILLSWLLLFLLLGIDWLSMMVVVILVDVVIMVFVRVVCMELLFIDKVEGSVGKLVMGLFGGLMLLIWKLVLVSLVSCLGLCKYLVNVLVVDVCFCDSYVLLSSIVGQLVIVVGFGGSQEFKVFLVFESDWLCWNNCCLVVIIVCMGVVVILLGLSSVFIVVVKELLVSLGCVFIRVCIVLIFVVVGVLVGVDVVVIVLLVKYVVLLLLLFGIVSCSDFQVGKFKLDNEFGLVCRLGNVVQFWLVRVCCNLGCMVSNIGDIISEWLLLMVWLFVVLVSCVVEMELFGIYNFGWLFSLVGYLLMKLLMMVLELVEVIVIVI